MSGVNFLHSTVYVTYFELCWDDLSVRQIVNKLQLIAVLQVMHEEYLYTKIYHCL